MTDVAVPQLTADEARELTNEIRHRLDGLLPLIKQAFERRADLALGYESWQAYCTAELNDVRVPVGDRPAMVAELRQVGMSQRAIAGSLGVSQPTVLNDLRRASDQDLSVEAPARVTSLDGRERPATQPPKAPGLGVGLPPVGPILAGAVAQDRAARTEPAGRYREPVIDPEAEELRQRRVATHQLCETVVALAQMRGFDTGWKYDPGMALPGRAVTGEVIADARQAIDELAKIWDERKLP